MSLARRFASAALQLTIGSALAKLLLLSATPVLTRWMSPESLGAAAMIASATALLAVFALAGADMSYTRAFHAGSPPNAEQAERFAWRFTFATSLAFGALGAVAWMLWATRIHELPAYLGGLLPLGVLGTTGQVMAQARARLGSRYRVIAMAGIAAAVLSVATSLLLAYLHPADGIPLIVGALVLTVVPMLIMGTPGWTALSAPSGLSRVERRAFLKIGAAGLVTAPMYWVITSLDRWMLGTYDGAASVGVYAVGVSVGSVGALFNTAIQSFWMPEAARAYEHNPHDASRAFGGLAERLIVCAGIVWLAVSAAGGDAIRLITSSRFHDAADVVPLIAGVVFLNVLVQFGMEGLLLSKRLHDSVQIILVGGIAAVGLNVVLVPRLGRQGAALAQVLALGIVAFGLIRASQRRFRMRLHPGPICAALAVLVAASWFLIPAWSDSSSLLSLALKAPVGMGVACAAFAVVAPQTVRSALTGLKIRRARMRH